jgi:hypothetical protein
MSVAHACESEVGLRQSRALRIEGVNTAAMPKAAATTAGSCISGALSFGLFAF